VDLSLQHLKQKAVISVTACICEFTFTHVNIYSFIMYTYVILFYFHSDSVKKTLAGPLFLANYELTVKKLTHFTHMSKYYYYHHCLLSHVCILHIVCDVPSIAVFCNKSVECLLGMASSCLLNPLLLCWWLHLLPI
jgi:hypothetical protein